MESGLVFNVQRYSLQDGPGIRTTLFLKGCFLACGWCHNPESLSPKPEIILIEDRCLHCGECRKVCPSPAGPCIQCGACVDACPTGARQRVGQRMTVREAMDEILKDRIFYDDSGGGVTLSGGEPLLQAAFAIALLAACQTQGIHTAMDTSGFAPQDHLLAAAAMADLILYDLKVIDDAKHIRYTGVSNTPILDNLRVLGRHHRNIWIRIPIIPGLNDSDADLDSAGRFVTSLAGVRKVCLLPYHTTGTHKFARLGRPYRLGQIVPPSAERMEQLVRRFRNLGLDAQTGG